MFCDYVSLKLALLINGYSSQYQYSESSSNQKLPNGQGLYTGFCSTPLSALAQDICICTGLLQVTLVKGSFVWSPLTASTSWPVSHWSLTGKVRTPWHGPSVPIQWDQMLANSPVFNFSAWMNSLWSDLDRKGPNCMIDIHTFRSNALLITLSEIEGINENKCNTITPNDAILQMHSIHKSLVMAHFHILMFEWKWVPGLCGRCLTHLGTHGNVIS